MFIELLRFLFTRRHQNLNNVEITIKRVED